MDCKGEEGGEGGGIRGKREIALMLDQLLYRSLKLGIGHSYTGGIRES